MYTDTMKPEQTKTGGDLVPFEIQAERGWDPRVMAELASAFSRSLHIRTAEQARQFSLGEMNFMHRAGDLHFWSIIEAEIERLSQEGKNVVFLGGPTPISNAFFHLIGARHRNVVNFNFFAVPLEVFVRFAEQLKQYAGEKPVADPDITTISGDTTSRIGDIK